MPPLSRVPSLLRSSAAGAPGLLLLLSLTTQGGCTRAATEPAVKKQETPVAVPQATGAALAPASEGAAMYARYCALCHAADGSGYAADNANSLRAESFLATASDEFLRWGIAYGRPGTPMAAFSREQGGPLGPAEITTLIAYLRNLRPVPRLALEEQRVEGSSEAGQRVYAEHCASCHGSKGEGGKAVSLSNPVFLATASDGFIRHAIAQGRSGTPMKAYAGSLAAEQLNDVTAYIRSWARTLQLPGPVAELPPAPTQLVINPEGPAPRFSPLREGRFVPADEVKAALQAGARMVLLDARPTSDWLKSHIPGALPVPFYDPKKMIETLPRDGTWIISYCACPHAASGKVMDTLRAQGFSNTAVLDEGVLVWATRGYPMTLGRTEP
ncbi:c-type cytochrome [Hyalangium sp.]|uniref:c-type cytochrome n=1 Tax=Hyalangium sp. TaxID=2028555 RepID=UPI002D65F686|nr:c-type cytochrome [Hyalangium sp.]HYH95627.1 c-type cytochrome [Hyalangium sp.]